MVAPGEFLTTPDRRYHSAEQAEALFSTCILQTESQAQDGQGGYAASYVNAYTDIPCRLMGAAGTGRTFGSGRVTSATATLTLLASQDVTATMRAWVDGTAYEVVRIHSPETFATTRRVGVRRVS